MAKVALQTADVIKASMRLGLVIRLETLTGAGEADPIPRIGVPYGVETKKDGSEVFVRMYLTHGLSEQGSIVELPEEERRYRTVPIHKIMEGSVKRMRELTYYMPPCMQ